MLAPSAAAAVVRLESLCKGWRKANSCQLPAQLSSSSSLVPEACIEVCIQRIALRGNPMHCDAN